MKYRKLKILLSIFLILLLTFITIKIYPLIKELGTIEGRSKFKLFLDSHTLYSGLILYLLHLLQMVLLILPGETIEIMYGICFGPLLGTILILLSIFINTYLIVYLTKKYGKKFIKLFFDENKIKKIEDKLKGNSKLSITILLIFLIPGTPKDLFTFIIGLLSINHKKFVILSTLARIPSVISSILVGSNILKLNITFIIIVYLITFILVFIILLFIKLFNKNIQIKDIIKL